MFIYCSHEHLNVHYQTTEKHFIARQLGSFAIFPNAIFGRIGLIASEVVILQLIKSKCIPSLLYGFDACAMTKSELSSVDFIVNRFFYEAI